jgi:hypothetical protein
MVGETCASNLVQPKLWWYLIGFHVIDIRNIENTTCHTNCNSKYDSISISANMWDTQPAVCQERCESSVSTDGLCNCRTALNACFQYRLFSVHTEKTKWFHIAAGF